MDSILSSLTILIVYLSSEISKWPSPTGQQQKNLENWCTLKWVLIPSMVAQQAQSSINTVDTACSLGLAEWELAMGFIQGMAVT